MPMMISVQVFVCSRDSNEETSSASWTNPKSRPIGMSIGQSAPFTGYRSVSFVMMNVHWGLFTNSGFSVSGIRWSVWMWLELTKSISVRRKDLLPIRKSWYVVYQSIIFSGQRIRRWGSSNTRSPFQWIKYPYSAPATKYLWSWDQLFRLLISANKSLSFLLVWSVPILFWLA